MLTLIIFVFSSLTCFARIGTCWLTASDHIAIGGRVICNALWFSVKLNAIDWHSRVTVPCTMRHAFKLEFVL